MSLLVGKQTVYTRVWWHAIWGQLNFTRDSVGLSLWLINHEGRMMEKKKEKKRVHNVKIRIYKRQQVRAGNIKLFHSIYSTHGHSVFFLLLFREGHVNPGRHVRPCNVKPERVKANTISGGTPTYKNMVLYYYYTTSEESISSCHHATTRQQNHSSCHPFLFLQPI